MGKEIAAVLPKVKFDLSALAMFILLEAGAIVTTKVILSHGGYEAYPLAVGLVKNIWLLIASKLFAVAALSIPYILAKHYQLDGKTFRFAWRTVIVCVLLVAALDVIHNLWVISGIQI